MWREKSSCLIKEFKFADFKSALAFVNKVGELAEAMNHHPEVEFGWGRVKLVLTTHSAGKITEKDRELAQKIDAIK